MDWQLTRYCSPVIDFLYQVWGSDDKAFREKHYDSIVEAYYQSMSDTIRKLGSDPDKLFTFNDLQNELRKFGRLAMLMSSNVYQARLADAGDLEETLTRDFEDDRQDLLHEVINGLFTDLSNYGYI